MIYWFSGWRPYGGMVIGVDYTAGPLRAGCRPGLPAGSSDGVLTDLGQVLAALCVAGIALQRRAVRLRRVLAAGTGWLRRLHSGLVGDQVTWLAAGLALLAALGEAALR